MERIGYKPIEVRRVKKEHFTVTAAPRPGSSISHDQWKHMDRNGQMFVGFSDGAGHGLPVIQASSLALDASFHFLNTFFSNPKSVEQARTQIELSIQYAAAKVWKETRGACTLSVVTFFEGYTIAGWVGDSRVYDLNNVYLSPITIPDSLNMHPYWDTIKLENPTDLYLRKQQLQLSVDKTTHIRRITADNVTRMFYDKRKQPGQLLGSVEGSQIVASSIDRKMEREHQIIICSDDIATTLPLPILTKRLKEGDDEDIVRNVSRRAHNDATIIRIPIK